MKHKHTFKKISTLALCAALSLGGTVLGASPVLAAENESEEQTEALDTREALIQDDASQSLSTKDSSETTEVKESVEQTTVQEDKENDDIRYEAETSQTEPVQTESTQPFTENEQDKQEENVKAAVSGTGASQSTQKAAVLNGWQLVSGKYYYYKNNVKYTGWHYMTAAEGEKTDHWSYFGTDGVLRTGWAELGQGTSNPDGNAARHWSYFGTNGWLRTGWAELGKGTSNPDGNAARHWSYFGTNGWLRTGWAELGQGTSNPDGNAARHWSYFGTNGWLRTGWAELGKGTSNPDGNAARHWSYFGPNGWLRTYWQQLGIGTPNPDGNATAHFSYFGSNGWLVTGTRTIDGKSYSFDNRGWLTSGSISASAANKNIQPDASSSAATSTPSTKQLIADGCYRISPVKNAGYSVDVWGESAADNTKIWSYANNDTSAQLFQIKHLGNNIYSIKTGSSIYASGWDISGGKAASGASIIQKKYTGASTQKWKIVSAGNSAYTFKPISGNLVVDIEGGNLSGGALKLATSTGSNTQKFKLTKSSGFLFRNGRKYYFNQNGDKPMIGIDVSAWSENIDWAKVKADGIEFAIIRAAHRGGQIDKYAVRNMSECTRLGIPFGVYCYSYATTNESADKEVDVLLSVIKNYKPLLGVFIDVEDTDTYEAAFGSIYSSSARRKITDLTKRMVTRVQKAGYTAGVYGNENYLNNVLYLNEMPNARWIARYYDNNASDTHVIEMAGKGYKIWQFTDKGVVNGIPNSGDADLNTLLEKYW